MPTLEQIQLKIAKLQAQAEVIAAKKASVVLNQIVGLMRKNGLTTAQIDTFLASRKPRGRPAKAATDVAAAGPKKRGRPAKAGAVVKKDKLPPKYRNPETGETWSGHARPPAWIKHVADRSAYLIAGAGASAKTAVKKGAQKTAVKKTARKTAAKKATVVKAAVHRGPRKTTANGTAGKTVARKTRGAATKRTPAADAPAEVTTA